MVFEEINKKLTNICKKSRLLHLLLATCQKIQSVHSKPSGAPEVNKSFWQLVGQAKVAGKRCSNISVDEHIRAELLLEVVLELWSFARRLIYALLNHSVAGICTLILPMSQVVISAVGGKKINKKKSV